MSDDAGRAGRPAGARDGSDGPAVRLEVSRDRIERRLGALARFTDPARPYTRRAFTPSYAEARAWLADEMRSSGLAVATDAGANLIGVRAGDDPDAPAWMLGSHIDTVPSGGRFDGVAGVVCALEVADALAAAGVRLRRSLCVVDFLSEEPSDYGPSCIGSRAWAGTLSEAMLASTAPSGETLADAIARVGGDPDAIRRGPVADRDLAGFLELHIEQGRRLEAAGSPIGLVDGIVAVHRYAWTIEGEAAHAGTTTMTERRDALVGAAHVVARVHERARIEDESGPFVATIGRLDVTPNGINVVPGGVELMIETRALNEARLARWYAELERDVRPELERSGLGLATRTVSTAAAARSDATLLAALRSAATAAGLEPPSLVSGAGHDAMQVAQRAPMAMVFVPSRDGVSHAPHEWTDAADLAVATEIMARALLRLDADG